MTTLSKETPAMPQSPRPDSPQFPRLASQPPAIEPTSSPEAAALVRLDKLTAERFRLSRRAAGEAVLNGRIDLDGETCDEPGRLVPPKADLRFDPNRPKKRKVVTAKLDILFEDRHLLIVNKPAGLLTLETEARETDTLRGRVLKRQSLRRGGRPFVGIVHRLDRETSGTLALALTSEAMKPLQALFRSHAVERRYLAIVAGAVAEDHGVVEAALVSRPGEVRRRLARPNDPDALDALTRYHVLERFGSDASLLACELETGRSHQIRVHLASIGHPVLGDRLYSPRKDKNAPQGGSGTILFDRQALHAETLGLVHPIVGGTVRVEAPLPGDFCKLISRLRHANDTRRSSAARRSDR